MSTSLRIVPSIPTGYNLDDGLSRLSIIVPEATVNLIPNPSLELATTGWTGTNVTIARSLARQYRGAYSLSCTRTAGADAFVSSATIAVTAGQPYTLSMYVYISQMRQQSAVLRLAWFSAGPTLISEASSVVEFQEAGAWRRIVVSGYAPTGATLAAARIGMAGAETGAVMFVDAIQLENKIYPTTYVDGDEQPLLVAQFPAPFGWNGARHNSSSYRLATTRAGGRVFNLSDLGLVIVAIIGLGMPPVQAISDPLGLSDGSNYQRSIRSERPFTIAGRLSGATDSALQGKRAVLRGYLAHDRTGIDQPLVLRYERLGQGAAGEIVASYTGGLEETADNRYAEDVSISFTQWLPLIRHEGDTATSLEPSEALDVNYLARRLSATDTNIVWDTFDTGANGAVNAIKQGPDGRIYIGGNFTTIKGAAAQRFAVYDDVANTFAPLFAGTTNGEITDFTWGPDGRLYLVGAFTTIGGSAINTVAVWNGSTLAAVGIGSIDGITQTVAVASSGIVYIGGRFSTINGNTRELAAQWNGATWGLIGTGFNFTAANEIINQIIIGPDGLVYFGGKFAVLDGNPGNNVVAWNGTAYNTLAGGIGDLLDIIYALSFDANGLLYAGGDFTLSSGVNLGIWNGAAWNATPPLTGGIVTALTLGGDDFIYAAGTFTAADGNTLPGGLARYTGSAWLPLDIEAAALAPSTLLITDARSVWVGSTNTAAALISKPSDVIYPNNALAYPTFIVNGPGTGAEPLYSLANQTTGATIYFNASVNAGEIFTLTLEPGNTSLISSTRGDLTPLILPGSSIGSWALVPGANQIVLFAGDTMGASLLQWRPTSLDTDDLIYR